MSNRDLLPFDEEGNCLICHHPAHARFFVYDTLAELLHVSPATIRTWASLTATFIREAHPNPDAAWRQLKAQVNSLPTGAAMILRLGPKNRSPRRAFQPLPPTIAPRRYDGCVAATLAYSAVLIGPTYNVLHKVAAINSRKKAAEALRGGGR